MTEPRPDGVVRLMMSFWYYRKKDMAAKVAATGLPTRLMVDSGAFSAHEQRGESEGVKLADYAAWLTDWWPVITTAINLDVISDPKASMRNQLALEERGLAVTPVWHMGSSYAELEALCRDYRYVAVGGPAVTETRRSLLLALSAKAVLIAREHGTVLHGLGRSGQDDLSAIPWYSADAASWMYAVFNGGVILYDRGRLHNLKHPKAARNYRPLLRTHGLDPAEMDHPSFALKRDRDDLAQYRHEYHMAERATAIAMKRFEAWLRQRHGHVPPPPGHTDAGPSIYFVTPTQPHEWIAASAVQWLVDQGEAA